MLHILVIDDDERIRKLLKKYLEEHHYTVTIAQDIEQAKQYLNYFIFDLIILDLMLPGEDGLTFAKKFKLQNSTPILILSALGETHDRIEGLEIGADDYLVKPFEPRELLLRMTKLIERAVQSVSKLDDVYFGKKIFNINSQNLLDENNNDIPLTTNERNIMTFMIKNSGKVLSRNDFKNILGNEINERSVDVQITRLRSKIEINQSNPIYLKTIRGEGYILYCRTDIILD